jgi:Ca2+:H+ antiporter
LLFLTTIALLVPSAVAEADSTTGAAFTNKLSVGLAELLIAGIKKGDHFPSKPAKKLVIALILLTGSRRKSSSLFLGL